MTREQLNKAVDIDRLIYRLNDLKDRVKLNIDDSRDLLYLLESVDINYKDEFEELKERFIILIDAKIQALNTEIEQL